jgi:hypothetical protein
LVLLQEEESRKSRNWLGFKFEKINHGFLNTVRSLPENEEWEMRVQRVMERQR